MLLESFEHDEGDRALFFSPIYSAEKSRNACFRFYYHMYGLLVGSLKVYIKPVSVDLESIAEEPKYVFFEMRGNRRNLWHEASFQLEELTESFQVIFEGVLRSSLYGDIAIDDVELMQGDACLPEVSGGSSTMATEVELVGGVTISEDNFAVNLSCSNRCGLMGNKQDGGCDCHSECTDSYTCCPDYGKVCLASEPTKATTTATTTTTKSTSTRRPTTTTTTMTTTTSSKRTVPTSRPAEVVTKRTNSSSSGGGEGDAIKPASGKRILF